MVAQPAALRAETKCAALTAPGCFPSLPGMATEPSGAKSEPVGTRPTTSQTSSGKGKVKDDVEVVSTTRHQPSASLDARVVYCGDNLDQLQKLPDACVDLIYIDPPFNSNCNYEVFWGETKEKGIIRRSPEMSCDWMGQTVIRQT